MQQITLSRDKGLPRLMSLRDDVSTSSSSSKVSQYPKEMVLLHANEATALLEPTQWEKQLEAEEAEINASPPPSLFYIENERCKKNGKRTFEFKGMTFKNDTINKYSTIRKNKSYDLCNPVQRSISDDIEAMRNIRVSEFSPKSKSGNKNKPRWNRKHQSEINEDRSMLCAWFENGILGKARAPNCPKSCDSEDISEYADSFKPANVRPATLGDFMPNSAMNEVSEEHNILELEGNENPESSQDISWDYSHVNVLTFATDNVGDNPNIDVTQSQVDSNYIDENSIGLNTNIRNISTESTNENNVGVKTKDPLCWHGIKYQAERLSELLYSESGMLLEKLPKRRIYAFANAVRKFGAAIKHLQCQSRNDRELNCTRDRCYWQRTMVREFNNREKRASNRTLTQVDDLVSFEIKMAEVYSPKSRLKALLGDAYDPNDTGRCVEHFLTIKYKKALQSLEDVKSKDFNMILDLFADCVFAEIYAFLRSLPEKESQQLRTCVTTFKEDISNVRDVEKHARITEQKRKCSNFFRLKKSEREKMFSDNESECLIKAEPIKAKPLVKEVSCQTDNIEVIDLDVPDTQRWPKLPVKQYSDAVKNSYVSPTQLDDTVDSECSVCNDSSYNCLDDEVIKPYIEDFVKTLVAGIVKKDTKVGNHCSENDTDASDNKVLPEQPTVRRKLPYPTYEEMKHLLPTRSQEERDAILQKVLKDSEARFKACGLDDNYSEDSDSVFDSDKELDENFDNRPENIDVSLYEEAKTNPDIYNQYGIPDIDWIDGKVTIRKNEKKTIPQVIPRCLKRETGDYKSAPPSLSTVSEIINETEELKTE